MTKKRKAARLFQMKDISAEDMEAIYNMCIWNSLAYRRKIEKESENCFMESAGQPLTRTHIYSSFLDL